MRTWLFPTNVKNFRIHDFLKSHDLIDFKQSSNAHVQVGDIVYLYCTLPEAKVSYKMRIEKINISYTEAIDDIEYSLTPTQTNEYQKDYLFCRLRLIKRIDSEELTLQKLRLNGLKSCLQSQQTVKPCLLSYIEKCFNK